jgi:hypothetical protein
MNENLPKWKEPCKKIPIVKVKVTCPPNYVNAEFLGKNFFYIKVIFILSIFLF